MARSSRTASTAVRPRSPRGTRIPPAAALAPPVRWSGIAPMVRALDATARGDDAARALGVLMMGLTQPLRELETLTALASRSLAGDAHASADLRSRLASIAARSPAVRAYDERLVAFVDDDCGCAHMRRVDAPAEREDATLDESALVSLLLAVARAHADCSACARDDALASLIGIAAAATTIAGLVDAHRSGGPDALLADLDRLAAAQALDWVGTPMRTLSGGMPGGFQMPGMPGGPGLPGVPGIPGLPDIGDLWPRGVDEILGWLKKPRRWDPEYLDHAYPWWRDPVRYIDPKTTRWIRCLMEVRRLLAERAKIAPPARPDPAVWITGITSITAGGACSGDRLVIRGSGLLVGGAVLLLPFAEGCRPVPVAPQDWTDTSVTVTLPPGVISGPIGFGDGAWIAAYDAWAAEQNKLASEISRFWCYRSRLPWVPRFHECPPDLGINRLRAGSAIIDAFTVAGGATTVVEPGATVTLAWTVRNAHHVRIDRIAGAGPGFGGSASLVDPAGNTWPLGVFVHTAPTTCVYRLTATGPCGAVTREVRVFASKRAGLFIASLEVTQSIQNGSNGMRLVARKPTVVRVTVRHLLGGFGGGTVPNVRGRIRVARNDGTNSGWIDAANGSSPMGANPGASITVQASPQRNNTNDTLNFLIPPGWCTLSTRFTVEVRVTGFGATAGFAGFDQSVTTTSGWFAFQPRRTLELRYVRVRWGTTTPTAQVCFDTLRTAVPLLPTPTANILPLAGVGVQTPGGTGDSDRDDLLDDFDDRHNCSWWEALWEWLGADCPDDDGAIWVLIPGVFHRGRAFDIPSNVCFTPPSNGPYAAHELSHCLDQRHVSVMCANGQQATGGDAPGGFPNNAQLLDVPFDVTRNVALTLAGTGVFDVMTYCGTPNNTWPMPVRWDRLWNQIG